jgi:O-antigen ligase
MAGRARHFVHGATLGRVADILNWRPLNWRTAFAAMLIGSVALSEDPHHHPVALVLTGLSACALIAIGLFSPPKTNRNLVSAGFALFMLAIAISFPVAMHNGISLFDWALRGAAPLAFLGCFFFLPIGSEDDAVFVVRAVLAATMVWSGFAAYELIGVFPLLSTLRWTILSGQLILPINVAGVALILFGPRVFPDPLRYGLLLVLVILTLGAAYRSQEIIIGAFLVAFCALSALGYIGRRHAIATAMTITAAVIVIAAIHFNLPAASNDRIFEIGGRRAEVLLSRDQPVAAKRRGFWKQSDTARLLEVQFAFATFLESPIVGMGLAYPVPSNLIFHGKEQELARLEAVNGKKYPYVFHVHNFVANVAMTMGLVGLTALAMMAIGSAFAFSRGWRQPARASAFAGLAGLATFSLVESSYVLPQFNLMIAALAAILVRPDETKLR